MEYKRWGRFRFSDYFISWISIVVLLLFSIASAVLELPLLFVIFPSVYAVIWLGTIFVPQTERFFISGDLITVFTWKKTQTISLPSALTLVVSHVDVCPPLTMHTAIGNKTHILKDKVSVSILKKIPAEAVLDTLHRNHVQKYTTSRVRAVFDDYLYIYSFVCDQSLFDALIANKKCSVVVPESLAKGMPFELSADNVDIVIDSGC